MEKTYKLYTYPAKLIRVIDGDTLKIQIDQGFRSFRKETIRLLGIDTPEIRTKDLEEKKRGYYAKSFVIATLKEYKNKFLVTTEKSDSFGRCLGNIILENARGTVTLSEILLKNHLAVKRT